MRVICWLLHLEGEVIDNRLDRQVCDIPGMLGGNFRLQFALPGAMKDGTDKDQLSVTVSAFPAPFFSKLLSKPWIPNIHVPARFPENEAA